MGDTVYTELTRRIAELEAQLALSLARLERSHNAESMLNNLASRLDAQNEALRADNARLRSGRAG